MQRWADDELRSLNAQIEYVLRDALRKAGRLPKPGDDTPAEGEETMSGRRWSYKVVQVKRSCSARAQADVEAVLAQHGQAGWELVNAVQVGMYSWLYLKKEI